MSRNCSSCGNPIGDSPFCSNCGAPARPEKKKLSLKLPSKKVLIAAAAAVVLVLLIVVIASSSSGGSIPTFDSRLYPIYSHDEEATLFASGTKLLEDTMDGDYYSSAHSIDYSVGVYETDEGVLYAASAKGLVEVGKDAYDFQLSADGSTVAYIDEDYELYIGSAKNGKTESVAEDVVMAVLSPNGKKVVFMAEDDDEYVTYLYEGKEPVELGEMLAPIAVSDNLKYIYCLDEKSNLVLVNKKGETTKLAANVDDGADFLFNKNLSQIIFRSKDKWYVCDKGGDKEKLDCEASYLSMVTPRWSQYGTFGPATIYNVDSLAGKFYSGSGALVWVAKNWESDEVTDEAESITASEDGKRVYFLENNRLKYVTTSKPDEDVDVAKHVYGYVVLSGGKTVYYYDEENILYCLKGGKESTEIEEDVYRLYKTHDEKVLFFAERDENGNGTLYTVKGTKATEISEDVYTVALRPGVTYYLEQVDDDAYDVYASKSVKFELLLEEAGY